MHARKNKSSRSLLILLLLLVLVCAGAVTAKYIQESQFTAKVTFTAELAESVTLQEHVAVRDNKTGAYTLSDTTTKTGNVYEKLIPGENVPKNPHIIIEDKTSIDAYLYIEIVDTVDTATINSNEVKLIDYTLAEGWTLVTNGEMTPKHGGQIYKYNRTLDETFNGDPIYILEDNEVIVSQYIKSHDNTTGGDTDVLTIYAYLVETAAVK